MVQDANIPGEVIPRELNDTVATGNELRLSEQNSPRGPIACSLWQEFPSKARSVRLRAASRSLFGGT